MTMAEFNIRLFSFKRLEKMENIKFFDLNRSIVESGMTDNKHKNSRLKSLHQNYIGATKNQGLNNFQREMMRKAQEEYKNRIKKK